MLEALQRGSFLQGWSDLKALALLRGVPQDRLAMLYESHSEGLLLIISDDRQCFRYQAKRRPLPSGGGVSADGQLEETHLQQQLQPEKVGKMTPDEVR